MTIIDLQFIDLNLSETITLITPPFTIVLSQIEVFLLHFFFLVPLLIVQTNIVKVNIVPILVFFSVCCPNHMLVLFAIASSAKESAAKCNVRESIRITRYIWTICENMTNSLTASNQHLLE